MWSRDHCLLSNHYIFSSIDHAVRNFYLVFDPGMVIAKYKMRLKLFKHMEGVCLEVVWGVLVEVWVGLGCFGLVWGVSMAPLKCIF